jgi:prevent-host-death family protein
MKATFLDLRRRPGRILEAIERQEEVTLSRRGREVALIVPKGEDKRPFDVMETAAFGLWKDRRDMKDPSAYIRKMRKGRFGDL